jgi:hypothetical protein
MHTKIARSIREFFRLTGQYVLLIQLSFNQQVEIKFGVGIEPTRTSPRLVAHHLPSLFNSNDLLSGLSSFLSLLSKSKHVPDQKTCLLFKFVLVFYI